MSVPTIGRIVHFDLALSGGRTRPWTGEFGLWAVTRPCDVVTLWEVWRESWHVTHIPTGRTVTRRPVTTRGAAVNLARVLAEHCTAPTWDVTDIADVPKADRDLVTALLDGFHREPEPAA